MGWERMVYTSGIAILVAGVCMAVLVGPAFMPMIFPDAEAKTEVTKYPGVTSNPVNPLHFRNDQYGNVHITSADFFVPRFLHCTAPASGYDAYIASGIIQGDGRMYSTPTWYSTDADGWVHQFTQTSTVSPSQMIHGGEVIAVVTADEQSSIGSYILAVYYAPNATASLSYSRSSLGPFNDYQAGTSISVNDLLMIDLDEDILRDRGYLHMTHLAWGPSNNPRQVGNIHYFLYSTLPGGAGGWQTFEYKPAILYTGGTGEPGATVTAKAGNLALGYNILVENSEVSILNRQSGSIGDFVRETTDGPFTAMNIIAPGHYQQIEPYWYPGAAGSAINTLTIPYYKLYDDPDNDSTSYVLTCQIVNPWGTEDLFSHRHTYTPRTEPVLSTYAQSWFTGNFSTPV